MIHGKSEMFDNQHCKSIKGVFDVQLEPNKIERHMFFVCFEFFSMCLLQSCQWYLYYHEETLVHYLLAQLHACFITLKTANIQKLKVLCCMYFTKH